jgi:hypothetical protein
VLEGGFELIVGNARHMKNVPGRKTHGDSVLELLHVPRQKFDRLIRSRACILVADEICWRWSWQAWHAWCANLSETL